MYCIYILIWFFPPFSLKRFAEVFFFINNKNNQRCQCLEYSVSLIPNGLLIQWEHVSQLFQSSLKFYCSLEKHTLCTDSIQSLSILHFITMLYVTLLNALKRFRLVYVEYAWKALSWCLGMWCSLKTDRILYKSNCK